MVERLELSDEIPKTLHSELNDLFYSPLILRHLGQYNTLPVTQVRNSADSELPSELNTIFINADDESLTGVSLPLFGIDHCGGVAISTKEDFRKKEAELIIHPKIEEFLKNGAEITLMTADDVHHWIKFCQQIDEEGIYDRLGSVAFELSGLTRVSTDYYKRLCRSTLSLVKNNYDYFRMHGVENIHINDKEEVTMTGFSRSVHPEMNIDVPFLRSDGETIVLVPMHHIRTDEMKSEILIEHVRSERLMVPGLIITREGENKREAYERAAQAQIYYQSLSKERIVIPVISKGQLSLWKKMGLKDIVRASIREEGGESQLEAEEVIRFLYLGENNLREAPLARLGYSLPGNIGTILDIEAEHSGIDIVFFKKDQFGNAPMVPIEEALWGIDMGALKKGNFKLKEMGNVAGIAIVPSYWNADEMSDHAKNLKNYLNIHMGKYVPRGVQILCLTQELFQAWKEKRTAVAGEPGNGEEQKYELQRKVAYGTTSVAPLLYYYRYQQRAAVGGAKTGILEVSPDGKEKILHVSNEGLEFDIDHPGNREMTAKASTEEGMISGLESGNFQLVPGKFDTKYLIKTAFDNVRLTIDDPKDYVASYLRSELYHRVSKAELETTFGFLIQEAIRKKKPNPAILAQEIIDTIYSLGGSDEQRWYRNSDIILQTINEGHGHIDHIGGKPFLDGKATVYASHETLAIEKAMDYFAPTWQEIQTATVGINEEKINNAYVRYPRPSIPIQYNGQINYLSRGLLLQTHFTGHSIPGAVAEKFFSPGMAADQGLVALGDIRLDDYGNTKRAIDFFAGKGSVYVMETTNGPTTVKPGAGISEWVVARSLELEFKEHPNAVIVVATPKNHPERLSKIMEAAIAAGRKIAVDYKHLMVNNQRKIMRAQMSPSADGYNVPIWNFGTDMVLWAKPMETPETYQQALLHMAQQYPDSIVDIRTLSKDAGDKYVVVISPYEYLKKLFSKAHIKELIYIYSSYFPYQDSDKKMVTANYYWLYHRYGRQAYKSDFLIKGDGSTCEVEPNRGASGRIYHASGHVTGKQGIDDILIPLLDGKYKGRHVVLEHGAHPDLWRRALVERMNVKDLELRDLYDTHEYLKKKLGLQHPSQLMIHSRLSPYNPRNPLTDDANNPLGITGFYLPFN